MRTLLLYICTALLFSCGVSKRSTELERHMCTDIILSDSLLHRDSLLSLERLLLNERLQARIIVTEWSRPDSLGKQHPIKTTEVNINKDKTEKSVKSEQSGSDALRVKKEDITQVETEHNKENIKSDTRLIPFWGWDLFVLGLIGLFFYWWMRHRE